MATSEPIQIPASVQEQVLFPVARKTSPLKDYVGHRFGRLLVLSQERRGKRTWATCQCDCGNIHETKMENLLTNTSSCGCLRRELNHTLKDRIGERFERLVVIAMERVGTVTYAVCQCDCGKQKRVRMGALVKGTTLSCGCLHKESKRKDLTDQRFGKLVVLSMSWGGPRTYCTVRCDCGVIKDVMASNLLRDNTTCCGCSHFRTLTEKRATQQLNAMKRRTTKKALPHTFNRTDLKFMLQYWHFCCAICGREDGGLWHRIASDHWLPLGREGCPGTIATNMLPLCHNKKLTENLGIASCNVGKRNREPIGWLIEKLGPSKAKKKLKEIEQYFAVVTARKEEAV